MADWIKLNLTKLSEFGRERLGIAQQEIALGKKRKDLDRLEAGLKSLLEVAIETYGDQRAKSRYEQICRVVAGGGDPLAKTNKTRLVLELLENNHEGGLTITAIQEAFAVQGIELSRNYVQTVLHQLRTRRGLVTKSGDLFSLTVKGRELVAGTKQPEKKPGLNNLNENS